MVVTQDFLRKQKVVCKQVFLGVDVGCFTAKKVEIGDKKRREVRLLSRLCCGADLGLAVLVGWLCSRFPVFYGGTRIGTVLYVENNATIFVQHVNNKERGHGLGLYRTTCFCFVFFGIWISLRTRSCMGCDLRNAAIILHYLIMRFDRSESFLFQTTYQRNLRTFSGGIGRTTPVPYFYIREQRRQTCSQMLYFWSFYWAFAGGDHRTSSTVRRYGGTVMQASQKDFATFDFFLNLFFFSSKFQG